MSAERLPAAYTKSIRGGRGKGQKLVRLPKPLTSGRFVNEEVDVALHSIVQRIDLFLSEDIIPDRLRNQHETVRWVQVSTALKFIVDLKHKQR